MRSRRNSIGGNSLFLDNTVQRAWRDANAVGRHISLNWDAVGTDVGPARTGIGAARPILIAEPRAETNVARCEPEKAQWN
jgi:hypothetical protein